MHVPYNYLPEEFSANEDIVEGWKKLISSSEYTLGPYVESFENKFADYIGAKHCFAVNNGTDALILALKACGIGKGDEVITVNNTFYATVGAIVAVGATAVLVDCDDRYQISLSAAKRAITKRTKAIIPVHWGGASPDMDAFVSLAKDNDLVLIEDACMGIGASVHGKSPGTFGLVGAYSMHPLKSLNAIGDGGMVSTDDDELAEWIKRYRNHGMVDRDHIDFWGVNLRMQPLQCVVLSHGLDRLEQTIRRRNHNAKMLDSGLGEIQGIKLPTRPKGYIETFALYMALCENRDDLIKHLSSHQIEAKIHYPLPLHKQKAASEGCVFNELYLEVSTKQADALVTLPVHQFVNDDQIHHMVETISKFYG